MSLVWLRTVAHVQCMGLREPGAVLLLGADTTAPAASLQVGCMGCVGGLQGHPVMDCSRFGSLSSRVVSMA